MKTYQKTCVVCAMKFDTADRRVAMCSDPCRLERPNHYYQENKEKLKERANVNRRKRKIAGTFKRNKEYDREYNRRRYADGIASVESIEEKRTRDAEYRNRPDVRERRREYSRVRNAERYVAFRVLTELLKTSHQ